MLRKVLTFYQCWYDNRRVPRELMIVRYEDLHRAPAAVLRRVLGFIGLEPVEEALVAGAVRFAEFSNMRRMEATGRFTQESLRPGRMEDAESYRVRRGLVGGYAAYLGPEDLSFIDEVIDELGHPLAQVPRLMVATARLDPTLARVT